MVLGEDLQISSKRSLSSLVLFGKGFCMGSADIIPGVSGGTVALITGIYEPLIDAIKSVNLLFIPYFFRGFVTRSYFTKAKENICAIDFRFLIPLAVGIAAAFLLIANLIGLFLEGYPTYTYAFFFGLILSSSFFVYRLLPKITLSVPVFILLGALSGFIIVGLEAIQAHHSLPILFLSGVITFCAMILPGISGAFILLLLGQYSFLLQVLRGFTQMDMSGLASALSYVCGGLVGLLVLSRVLSYLIKEYRIATLSFLLGLMIGALRKPGELIWSSPQNGMLTLFSAALGFCIVVLFGYYQYRIQHPMSS